MREKETTKEVKLRLHEPVLLEKHKTMQANEMGFLTRAAGNVSRQREGIERLRSEWMDYTDNVANRRGKTFLEVKRLAQNRREYDGYWLKDTDA